MRISADCIDQEVDTDCREQELSRHFSQMDLNGRSRPQNDNELTGDEIRVIYKVNYSSEDSTAIASLSVIPVVDYHKNGYFSEWHEVKQQIIDLSFKDKSEVPKGLQFVALIKALEYELEVNSREDYFTALKVAEIYGQPLDVMIKTSLEPFASQLDDTVNQSSATASQASNKVTDRQNSSEANKESIESTNGFVLLNTAQKCETSSDQSNNRLVVMDERQIEKIKKEITIDVTKRLITKLSECLTDLTNETTAQTKDYKTEYVVGEESGESLSKVVHKGIICDNCDKQIEGIRYKCINCVDYDLCEPCKQKPVHYPNHTFNKIERYIRGIPKQTLPPTLDFLKPFLSGATIDPNTRDVVLTLDVDLTNGTISKTNVSPTGAAAPHNDTINQTNDNSKPEEPKCESNKKSSSDDDVSGAFGPHMPQKRYCSEKRAKQITKKLEKLKQKSYFYNQLLSTNDDRSSASALDRSKPTTSGAIATNPSLVSNKTLYLSGLLIGDETIPEGTRMPPNTKFRKTWKVRNTGTKVWSGRTTLRFVWGHPELEPFGKVTEVQAPTLRPGEEGKVTIRFTSPNTKTLTRYQSYWRLHHRGQPFGPRLVVKVVVDPTATAITPTPSPLAPILSKDSRNSVNALPPRPTARPIYPWLRSEAGVCSGPVYQLNETTCNLEAVSHIQQSIFESQRNISDKLLAMSNTTLSPPTPSDPSTTQNKEKTQKTSAKKLTEALSQVKELRFDLDENETIPMKSNVKSHTTTPANTPFDVSPPKSPEPTTSSASFGELQTHEKTEKSNENKSEEKLSDDKNDNESDGESLDVLSLSSGNESSDEFVLVPFPKCFDLNVPFGIDTEIIGNDENNQNNVENNFEVINNNTNDASGESDDDNTRQTNENNSEESQPTQPLLNEANEEALDLTKERPQSEEQTQSNGAESQNSSQSSTATDSEPQIRNRSSNPSTNPFRNSGNEGENVIHVLPESIVTGALSAAAHVYNNVSRALFSRNEGTNFAWVTSPPPAALPLPNMYWDDRTGQYPPSQGFYGPNVHQMPTPSAPQMHSAAAPDHQSPPPPPPPPPTGETASRVSSALKQLYEMGFWNQKLNQELLAKNDYDVNDTIEDLLSPDKNRHSRNGSRPTSAAEPVVSHQPRNSRNGFIDEFD